MEYKYIITSKNELYHYGIKGQKWGVRRYQNSDGSLTPAGKERYYNDDEQKELYEHSRSHINPKGSHLTRVTHTIEGVDDISQAGEYLRKQAEVITDTFNKLSKSYDKDIADLKNNKEFMSAAKKELDNWFGGPDKVDDEDFLEMAVDDFVYENLHNHVSKQTKDLSKKFVNDVDQYYENAKSITEDIIGKYGDMQVGSRVVKQTVTKSGMFGTLKTVTESEPVTYKEVVENTLHNLAGSSWVRYMNNHQEATWIESDSFEGLSDIIKKEWGYK